MPLAAPVRQFVPKMAFSVAAPTASEAPGLVALVNTLAAERDGLFILPINPATGPELVRAHLATIAASGTERVLTACSDGEVVGLITGWRGSHPVRRGVVDIAIGVRAGHRGQGIGLALLTALEGWAQAAGCHRLQLSVATANAAAIALCGKAGFVVEGVLRAPAMIDGAPIDEFQMAKLLDGELPDASCKTPGPVKIDTEFDGGAGNIPLAPSRLHLRRAPVTVAAPTAADVPRLIALINALAAEHSRLFILPVDPETGAAVLRARLAAIAASAAEAVLTAQSEGEMVGMITGSSGVHPARRGVIDIGIGVRASHRGRGVGGALMTALEGWARRRGCRRLQLSVATTNAPAIALYRKRGFVVEGVLRASAMIDGEPLDELQMAKLIGPESATC